MYELSLSGAVFTVGVALWFRPVLGLIVIHRYLGPPGNGPRIGVRERIVRFLSVACIVVGVTVAVWSVQAFS